MKRASLVILAAIIALLSGCAFSFNIGDGVTVLSYSEEGIDFSEERAVGYFESFAAYGPFNVYFVQSESQKVLVEGKEEFVKKVRTEVSDKVLSIKLEKGKYEHLVLRVTVYSPDIEDIATYGSGSIFADSLVCEEISLSAYGSGDVTVTGRIIAEKGVDIETIGSGSARADSVICKELEASVLGSGGISIEGAAVSDEMDLSSTGSGSISVNGKCRKVKASAMGSGGISIEGAAVSDEMDLSSTGSGDISVNGKCRKVKASAMGSGSIHGKVEYSEIEKNSLGSGKIMLKRL